MSPEPTVRPLRGPADFEACVALQKATWGDDFRELVAPAMLLITQKVGGIAAGAFDDGDRLVGFVYGLTGVRDGRLVHWSHMLAVAPAWRDKGLGRRLKAWQRERLREIGVERMYWTFDPLVARNAHLNLAVLGARVVEYRPDMYGDSATSRMDSVIGSDRFVVEWEVGGTPERVRPPSGRAQEAIPPVSPESPDLPDAPEVHVAIPPDIQSLKTTDPEAARRWRAVTRAAFEHYLTTGYRVAGFRREATQDRPAYVVARDAG